MIQVTTLAKLPPAYKVLFTGFLLVIGVGLLMAGFQIMETHGKADQTVFVEDGGAGVFHFQFGEDAEGQD